MTEILLYHVTPTLYVSCWFLSALLHHLWDVELYDFTTKEDTIYSLLKILFAPFVFIPWGLYAIGKEAVRVWMEKPDTRKDIKR